MNTTLLLTIIFVALLITVNSDLEKVYNVISKFLFGNQRNICRY